MTKESKQGLGLACKVVGIIALIVYLIVVAVFLKLDVTTTPAFAAPEFRGLAVGILAITFVIVWQCETTNARNQNSRTTWIQSGGKLTRESIDDLMKGGEGKDAWVERSNDGQDFRIRFENPA